MSNQDLIQYLKSCWNSLETSFEGENADSKMLQYLYFAPLEERMQIHKVEKLLGCGSWQPLHFDLKQNDQDEVLDIKTCNEILQTKPFFEEALRKRNITSIANYNFSKNLDNTTVSEQVRFKNDLSKIEKSKGILNALLKLRNWKTYPDNLKGSKNCQKLARNYLRIVLGKLDSIKNDDEVFEQLIEWYSRGKRKIKIWSLEDIKKKKLRSPPLSALPLYKDEVAGYVRHFLQLTCNAQSPLKKSYAEMVVLLSLCIAAARQCSNFFKLANILKITKNSIRTINEIPPTTSSPIKTMKGTPPTLSYSIISPRKQSKKSPTKPLQFVISNDFLDDEKLWLQNSSPESLNPYPLCKVIRIQGKFILISERLAHAIEWMGAFSIKPADVDNRLQEAFKLIGLSQSSGDICPKAFLSSPHYSPGVDLRKSFQEKNNRKNNIRMFSTSQASNN